jgi:hypothetical protein
MVSQTQVKPDLERRKSGAQPESKGWIWFLVLVTLLLVAGFIIAHPPEFVGLTLKLPFKPGDNFGYNIGLVGGLMMLTLLIYPARKRFAFMNNLGILPEWFKWHMIFGVLGPALVLFHSTFVILSINAGVALGCMMLVSGSGIFGRFFYTKIHHGLYGRQTTLKVMQDEMLKTGSFKRSFSSFAPGIDRSLDDFRVRCEEKSKPGQGRIWDFVAIGFQAAALSRSLEKELHREMYSLAHEKHWDSGQAKQDVDKLYVEYVKDIRVYLTAVRDAAQFSTYEKLFSLWHLFHIPLVYMLVFSGIYHVIAVHMY